MSGVVNPGRRKQNGYHRIVEIRALRAMIERPFFYILACAIGLLVSFGEYTVASKGLSIWNADKLVDASSFRNAAQFLGTGDLYNGDAYVAVQRQEYQVADSFRVFLRPPWYALAVFWQADMSRQWALIAWRFLMLLATGLFVWMWPSKREAFLAMCWSLSLVRAIHEGQDDSLILAGLALSLFWAHQGKDFLAGFVLAVCTIKPNLFIFVPVAMLAAPRAKVAWGLFVGIATLVVVSHLVQGPAWPGEFLNLLLSPQRYNSNPHGVSLFYLAKTDLPSGNGLAFVVLLAGGVVCVYRIAKALGLEIGLCAALAAAVVTSPHAYLQDGLLLIPFLLLSVHGTAGWKKWLALFTLSSLWAIPYFLVTRGTVSSPITPLLITLPAFVLLLSPPRQAERHAYWMSAT
jgi:hypothetical protein